MDNNQFIKELKAVFKNKESDYIKIGDSITPQLANKLRRLHQLPEDSKLLFYSKDNAEDEKGIVFTDKGISRYWENSLGYMGLESVKFQTYINFTPWNEIDRVEFTPVKGWFKNDLFYFYGEGGADNYIKFTKFELTHFECDPKAFEKVLNSLIKSIPTESDLMALLVETANKKENYEEVLSLCDLYIREFTGNAYDEAYPYFYRGFAYEMIAERYKEGTEEAKKFNELAYSSYFKGASLGQQETQLLCHSRLAIYSPSSYDRFKSCIYALEIEDEEIRQYQKNRLIEIINNDLFCDFSNDMKTNKELIFFVKDIHHIAGCVDEKETVKWVFPITNYPTNIKFPIGHPQANTLYINNSIFPNVYVPYTDSKNILFLEEISVFQHLCQGLGATKISFRSLSGLTVNAQTESSSSINGNIDIKASSFETEYNTKNDNQDKYSNNKSITKVECFEPIRSPYVIEECKPWIEAKPDWKRFETQRLEGNMLSHTQKISTSESIYNFSHEVNDVKIAVKHLMLKAKGTFEENIEKRFDSQEDSEWEISVEFKPLSEFK